MRLAHWNTRFRCTGAAGALLGALLLLPLAAAPGRVQAAQPQAGQTVSLDFVNADLNTVVKALSIQSGANAVVLPSAKGNVTVRLVDVPVEEALRRTAAAAGATVLKVGETYFIGAPEDLRAVVAQSGIRSTYTVAHQSPADLQQLLQHQFPFLTVQVLGMTKVLVLAGNPEDVQGALALARSMDTPAPVAPPPPPPAPPSPVSASYMVRYARPEVVLQTLQRAMPDVRFTLVDRNLVIEALPDVQAQVAKMLEVLDTEAATPRVVRAYTLKYLDPTQASQTLEAVFTGLTVEPGFDSYSPRPANFMPLSTSASGAISSGAGAAGGAGAGGAGGAGGGAGGAGGLGMQLPPGQRSRVLLLAGPEELVEQATQVISALDVAPQQVLIEARVVDMSPEMTRQLGFSYSWSSLNFNEGGAGPNSGGGRTFSFGIFQRSPFSFNATLDAMEQRREAKILMKPNIAVVDGEEASIFIGDILRFQRAENSTAVGTNFTIEEVPVGVALLCRPRVNSDGRVTLKVHPVVSAVTALTGPNRDVPQTSSREADSTIIMQDGQTIAIGGLLRDEDIRTMSKIPILGDIPILGELFRSRGQSKRRSEVTIFLTVRILKA